MKSGNFYDKYASRNPIERRLLRRFLSDIGELADNTGASRIHEVGCGEGMLLASLARPGRILCGSDRSAEIIQEAKARHADANPAIQFEPASIEELDPARHAAELVVCCEVLEHLPDPDRALSHLSNLAQPYLLLSVPREPLWRFLNVTRLKYLRDLGNTPGHINHWSAKAFVSLLCRHLDVVEVRQPLPWTVALCRTKEPVASNRARQSPAPVELL